MQKTEVLKLNTSKDNVEQFFTKMKSKFADNQAQGDSQENYDITMIVKHQGKVIGGKQNPPQNSFKNVQTNKSIFTENDPNSDDKQNSSCRKENQNQEKKQKPKIYDENMHIESRILPSQASISGAINSQQKNNAISHKKIRQSNKMPSIGSLFQFHKKKDDAERDSEERKKTKKSEFSAFKEVGKVDQADDEGNQKDDDVQKEKGVQEDEKKLSQSAISEISMNSEAQQIQEEQLKKHISRRHIDIFPNIDINGVISEKLVSLRSMNNLQNSKANQRRRCSINDQNLLSPRIKNQLDKNDKKNNYMLIKGKGMLGIKSEKHFQARDCIKEVADSEENAGTDSKKESRPSVDLEEPEQESSKLMQKPLNMPPPSINRFSLRQATQTRNSALAKKSAFEPFQTPNSKLKSKQKLQFSDHSPKLTIQTIQIQPQAIPMNQQSSSQQQNQSQKSSTSSNQQNQDSIYAIENKLNQCIKLLEKNQLSTLEDFLYQFKNKYFYVSNTRIQIKWRLLMAHCKENKKEFERAAINYNNVISQAMENPKALVIEPAQVYHRLGVCYSEIGWWNKGIIAFAQALNRYKRQKDSKKYSECMNNLGTLYLQAESLNLAEKCFVQSYNLKKHIHGKTSTKLLTCLFNIFQCNLLTKNYDQAENVIHLIEQQIISAIPETQSNKLLYLGGLYRRKGKMQFLRGNLTQAQNSYLKAYEKLSAKYPYCMEFGELMSCLGLLKLENKKFKEAKQYYDKAIMLMNFYCSKDSKTILTLKKNLQYAVRMIKEYKEGEISKKSTD